jgi:hypothetical protein
LLRRCRLAARLQPDRSPCPVDHECHSNPTRSEGSDCDKRRLLGESDGHFYAAYLDVPRFDAKATVVDVKHAERD